jgi:hypothetical protein
VTCCFTWSIWTDTFEGVPDTWIGLDIEGLATFVIAREDAKPETRRCRPIFMATYVRMFIMILRAWIRPSQRKSRIKDGQRTEVVINLDTPHIRRFNRDRRKDPSPMSTFYHPTTQPSHSTQTGSPAPSRHIRTNTLKSSPTKCRFFSTTHGGGSGNDDNCSERGR